MKDLRHSSLEELTKLKEINGYVFTHEVRKSSFSLLEHRILLNRLLDGKAPNLVFEQVMQSDLIEITERSQKDTQEDVNNQIFKVTECKEEYESRLRLFKEAEANLEEARRELSLAEKKLEKFKRDVATYAGILNGLQKKSGEMEKYILIHKSAKLNQAVANQYGTYVVTEHDAIILRKIAFVDEVFKSSQSLGFIQNIPYSFEKSNYSKEEKQGMIDYAEMVIYYSLDKESSNVRPVFSCEEIANLLKANGYKL